MLRVHDTVYDNTKYPQNRFTIRLASLVGITERESGVGKLGWHGNSTGFDKKKIFPILRNKRKK